MIADTAITETSLTGTPKAMITEAAQKLQAAYPVHALPSGI